MGLALNNVTAPDNYTAAATLDGLPAVSRLNIDSANQAIFWQLKQIKNPGTGQVEGMATWGDEVYMAPGSRSLFRAGIIGWRFRAAIPTAQLPAGAVQAQVTAEAIIG